MKKLIFLSLFVGSLAQATDYHVTTSGGGLHDGSDSVNAMTFVEAINFNHNPHPGYPAATTDTVWIHGGTYAGPLFVTVYGTAGHPVIFRAVPGEQVLIAKSILNDGNAVLRVGNDNGSIYGSNTWWWGFEVAHTTFSPVVGWSGDYAEGEGITMGAKEVRVINCYIHDTPSNGIGCKTYGAGGEVYGTIILYSGRSITVPSHAYGIYTQSGTAVGEKMQRRFENNIIPYTWSAGTHAYTINATVDSMYFRGNVWYNSGILWRGNYYEWSIVLGSTTSSITSSWDTVQDNHMYFSEERFPASRHLFGNVGGTTNLLLAHNIFSGGEIRLTNAVNPTVTGNFAYHTKPYGFSQSSYPDNVWLNPQVPYPNDSIFVIPNKYESGRANVVLYNWSNSATKSIDPSLVLAAKDSFVVKDPLNWNGPDVLRGKYEGGGIILPMAPRPIAQNIWDYDAIATDPFSRDVLGHPFHTLPRFAVFVLMRLGTPHAAAQAPTGSVTANPSSLPSGGGSTILTVTLGPATDSAWVDNGVGIFTADGSKQAFVSTTTLFAATFYGPGGTSKSATRVTVGSGAQTILFDAAAVDSGRGTSKSITMTVGSDSNRIMIVSVAVRDSAQGKAAISSVKLNGAIATKIGEAVRSPFDRNEMWYFLNPPSGPNTVTASFAAFSHVNIGVMSFSGVDQSTPLGTAVAATGNGSGGSDGPASVSVSSAPDELVVDGLSNWYDDALIVDASQTRRYRRVNGGICRVDGAGSTKPGASSVTMRWTGVSGWGLIAVPLKPAGRTPGRLKDITSQGTAIALITSPTGRGNPSLRVIQDGVFPPSGSTDSLGQYTTYTSSDARTFDWVGYQFPLPHIFVGVTLQEGMHFLDGGWFTRYLNNGYLRLSPLKVQVGVGGVWRDAQRLVCTPAYGGADASNYQTYDLRFSPAAGDGIRIAGIPGGSAHFISVGELRALANDDIPLGERNSADMSLLATTSEQGVRLEWWPPADGTAIMYEIQRSMNPGESFTTIHALPASPDSAKLGKRSMTFMDPDVTFGKRYYRLRQMDQEGEIQYSQALEVQVSKGLSALGIPKQIVLEQNYPNPFNPSSVIRYGLPRSAEVTIAVYNSLGQVVTVLVRGMEEAGYHEISFDGSGLASGLYFCRLKAGDYATVKKLLLLK